MNTGIGGNGQLRALVERDSDRALRDALWSQLQNQRGCIDYCVERCAAFLKQRSPLAATLLYRAGQILGWDTDQTRGRLQLVVRRGGYSAVELWLAGPPAMPSWKIAGPDLGQIGFVYTARVSRLPHVLKVGFSQDPDRRMKELEHKFGEPMTLVATEVGTPLDEAHAHCCAGRRYIGREFLFAPGFDDIRRGRIPHFLLGPFSPLAED